MSSASTGLRHKPGSGFANHPPFANNRHETSQPFLITSLIFGLYLSQTMCNGTASFTHGLSSCRCGTCACKSSSPRPRGMRRLSPTLWHGTTTTPLGELHRTEINPKKDINEKKIAARSRHLCDVMYAVKGRGCGGLA